MAKRCIPVFSLALWGIITLRQLEIFAAIYQEGAVTGAAKRIGLPQAATSQVLAELENQLQAPAL